MAAQGEWTSATEKIRTDRNHDWRNLALLLLLVMPLRFWLIFNTEVAARDSIGFIRYALQFENNAWETVLLSNHQHPGYPLAIWAVSQPIRALAGTDPLTMRVSAQLASTLAALALLIPMYFLGKELFNRQVGFCGALVFQYLPVSGHHLSDGISEALFLFLVAMSLWRGLLAIRTFQPRQFAWCGVWGGAAYLTRPEGALVIIAAGVMLAAMQLRVAWRKPWPALLACELSLGASAALVGSIYFLATGHFTNKPAVWQIGNSVIEQVRNEVQDSQREMHQPLFASVFGMSVQKSDYFPMRLGRALGAMGAEFAQGFHYVGWVPALLGLWWGWPRLRHDPGFWIVAGYCLLHAIILLLLAMVVFYVSDRHLMVLIMCGSFYIVAGIQECACSLWAWALRRRPEGGISFWLTPRRLTGLVVLAGVLACVPKTGQRLHGNRAGNHRAGLWLAPRLAVGDLVIDDHAYSHYYAKQVFEEGKTPVLPRGYQPTCYVVVTRAKDVEIDQSRKGKETEVRQQGRLVYQWPENQSPEEARVVIYAQPRDWSKNPWSVAP